MSILFMLRWVSLHVLCSVGGFGGPAVSGMSVGVVLPILIQVLGG